jgi:hypothetical protein
MKPEASSKTFAAKSPRPHCRTTLLGAQTQVQDAPRTEFWFGQDSIVEMRIAAPTEWQ